MLKLSTFTLNNREISNLSTDYENDGIIDLVQTPQGDIVVQEPPSPTIYTYDDLINVGKDSVKIIKVENKDYQYELQTMPLDSFEKFKNGDEDFEN